MQKNMSFVTAVICQAKKVCMKPPAMVFKSGSGVPKHLGGGDPKRLGSGVPKRLGGGAPKRLGSRVPKRLGGSAPKRFVLEPYQVSKRNGIQKNVSTPSHCLYCRRKAYAYACWDGSNGARPTARFPAQPPWRFGVPFPTSRTVAGCFIAQRTGKTRNLDKIQDSKKEDFGEYKQNSESKHNETIQRTCITAPLCSCCRRRKYALACLGKAHTATRWQEWCVPLLPNIMIGNAANTMRLVQAQLQLFVGQQACLVNNLSRIGAGLDVGVTSCTCCHAVRTGCDRYILGDLRCHGEEKSHSDLPEKYQHTTTVERNEYHKSAGKTNRVASVCRWVGRMRMKQARYHCARYCCYAASQKHKEVLLIKCKHEKPVKRQRVRNNGKGTGCASRLRLVRRGKSSRSTHEVSSQCASKKLVIGTSNYLQHATGGSIDAFPRAAGPADKQFVSRQYTKDTILQSSNENKEGPLLPTNAIVQQFPLHHSNLLRHKHVHSRCRFCQQKVDLQRIKNRNATGAYVRQQLSDEYVLHCCTCHLAACQGNESWTVKRFQNARSQQPCQLAAAVNAKTDMRPASSHVQLAMLFAYKGVRETVANNTIDVSPDALGSVVQTHTGKPPIELEHAKRPRQYALDMRGALPVRFQGGGTEQLQCFMCLAYKRAYVPKRLSEEYVSHCYTCGRGACDNHGSWEVGHFHCALCHATDDGFLAEVKDTFAVRCLSKTFQNQRLLHTNEEAFNDLMLTLCTGGTNRRRGTGNYDEQGLKMQPHEAADVELPWDDAQQLVAAILLSRLGTAEDAAKVLGQSWVPTWDGWKELHTCTTEAHCVAVADRLCDIAQVNAPGRSMTDTQALKALAAEGFRWQQALSHGVNNCLIDSLMLCLAYEGLLPSNLGADVAARRRSAVACRKHLVQAVGQAVLPSAKGFFPYLDAHRDGPHIVTFLLQRFRAVARANMIIRVHDRFGECTADPDRNKILVHLGFEHPEHHAVQLHIYNHTSVQGRGYHFDSLLRQTPVREAEPTVETDSMRTSANMDRTAKDVDRRAEAVFAKLAWRLCGSSFDIPWLEALLLNLLFHGYLSMGPSVMASQKARHQLCRSCQRHLKLDPKPDEAEAQIFDLQSHLAAAIFFLLGTSGKNVNADVYVHDASTTDLNVPRDSYRIGPPDSLLVPIFRLYCFQNGQYAALLPDASAAVSQQEPALMRVSGCSSQETQDVFGTAEAGSSEPSANMERMREILQRFCDSRGAKVQISKADVRCLQEAWSDRDAEGICLHTLLQAGLRFADSGIHHARRLADQFRSFHNCCTQGAGQTLAGTSTSAATHHEGEHLPPTVPIQPNAADSKDNRKEPSGQSTDEGGASRSTKNDENPKQCGKRKVCTAQQANQGKGKQQRLQRRSSVSTDRKLDVAVPLRRLRQKTAPGSGMEDRQSEHMHAEGIAMQRTEGDDGDIYLLRLWRPSQGNQDPRAAFDRARQDAAALLSDKPTLPERFWGADDLLKAYDPPDFHCAFRACRYECATQQELAEHIANQHADALHSLSAHWSLQVPEPKATLQAYHEVLTWHSQQLAPIANCSVDRRCLRRLRLNLRGKQVGAAICFICARRYPFVHDFPNQEIRWQRAFDQITGQFFGQSAEDLEKMLGFHTYHARYVATLPADTQMSLQPELGQWTCNMSCPSYTIRVVACPEDKTCYRRCSMESVCTHCEVPICSSCWNYVSRQRSKPPAALSNDMILGHPPREIYTQECTVLELLCASPCMTALTCFSIEWRYLQDRSLAQDAFMNRHRLCAKGNATTFPLPWEDLLSEFQRLDEKLASNHAAACLPHVGKALSDKIAVIIKIGDKKDKAAMRQHIIHQAVVRRQVVVKLIAAMVARSHPAYKGIDMALVEARAEMLPENDVPAEIIALLDNDGSLNHVLRQKAATPFNDQMSEAEVSCEFGRLLKPNAVVLEKTTAGCHDLNAQHVSALEDIVTRSQPAPAQPLPEVTLYTGTKLLDQFQPLYFALAFPFVFPYGIGLPDVPKWSQRKRLRRHTEDPHVELNTWVKVMARRIEAQVSRDWVFGFTSWNLLFRSALNLSRTTDAYSRSFYDEETQEWVQPTGKHVEQAAQDLLLALKGSYIDVTGQPRPVKGDVTKLRYVQGLKPMARKLLTNMRHTAQGLPGTQEARKRMRFEIQAMRIRYGVPLFVTYTPDEAHQLLFVRMTRVQASDPIRAASVAQDFPAGDMFFPDLGTAKVLRRLGHLNMNSRYPCLGQSVAKF